MMHNRKASDRILLMGIVLAVLFAKAKPSKENSNSWQNTHKHNFHKIHLPHSEDPPATGDPEFKVVCYLGNQEWDPNKINVSLCSHIVYIYLATLNTDNLLIQTREISAELQQKVAVLKKKGIKVLIAMGGWNDSSENKYSRLVKKAWARVIFVEDVVKFLEKSGFDGLELQWQYPRCWQGDCSQGPNSDQPGFTNLIKDLHEAFKPKGLLLSAYVAPHQIEIDKGYEVSEISKYLDWIAVMCHSYHGYWDGITGHVAPLYPQPHDSNGKENTNFSINYWIQKGAERKKLLMTIPTFGRTYFLRHARQHGLNSVSNGAGEGQGGIPYSKICQNIIKKGWTMMRDKENRIGPYAYEGYQWVSFDDPLMVQYKSEYIKHMGLGGAMIWSLEFDDFDNVCNCESYPLLKTINRVLRNYPEPDPKCYLDFDNNLP